MTIGEVLTLYVIKVLKQGAYLAADKDCKDTKEQVLLPAKEVPEGIAAGDELDVFIYKDSEDRPIATRVKPLLCVGEYGRVKVCDVGKIGAFVDIGLPKDVLLPFKEQTCRVKKDDEIVAALYVDKSGRLAATMKLYHYLKTSSPYKAGDDVSGTLYEISGNFGAFVAVDDLYSGLIPKKDFSGEAKEGDRVNCRVTRVLEDGKLNLSIRDKAFAMIEPDSEAVLEALAEYGGVLPFTDKADPEIIRHEMSMSKAAFKRAVGHLLKEGKIEISEEHKIRLK